MSAIFVQGQHTFEFNRPGNACNFFYITFTPGNEDLPRSPTIIVLAKPMQSVQEAFDADTLKYLPAFYRYRFVYLPNQGGSPERKLDCIGALATSISAGLASEYRNRFLQVNDTLIKHADLVAAGVTEQFAATRIGSGGNASHVTATDSAYMVTNAFKVVAPVATEGMLETRKPTQNRVPFTGPPKALNYTLSGVVKDVQTGEALPFATVTVAANGTGTNGTADGYFTLLKVPTDTSKLKVQYMGYETAMIYLSPQTPHQNFVIELMPIATRLDAVVITTERDELMKVNPFDVSTITMTPRKLSLLPNAGEKDVMRAYQLMPGVSASNESSSGMYVRGGTPDQNLILYDGFVIYHVDHLYGFFSAFNSNALKEVQLYKGGFESRFGGRISSVTEITGKTGNQKKFNLGGDLSLLSVNAFAEIPIGKKISSIVAYRRSYKGPIYNKIFDKFNLGSTQDNQPQMGGPGGASQQKQATSYFYDLNAKLTFNPDERNIFSWSFFNGTDKLDSGFDITTPDFLATQGISFDLSVTDLTRYGNLGTSGKWARRWTPKLNGTTLLSYSRYYSLRERGTSGESTNSAGESTQMSNGIDEENNLRDLSLKSDYQWDVLKGHQLQAGVFGTYYDISYTYAQNDSIKILDRRNQGLLTGAYVQDQFRFLHDRVQVVPGVRGSYFSPTNQFYWEPRFSLVANLTSKLALKGATGRYYQFVNRVTREDILSGSRDFWILSDDQTVPVSSAWHYIAGLSYDQGKYLFSAEAYYKQLSGLSEYSLRFKVTPDQASYDENFFVGSGYAKGIEFLAQKKTGNLTGWLSYTLSQTRSKFDVYSQDYFPANQDVTHEFKAVSLYHLKRWNFSATWIYATGRPYTAPSGAYTIDLLTGTQDYFTVTSKNSLRLPDYHRMDVSANYTLLQPARMTIDGEADPDALPRREIGSIGFSIFNLYNHKNVWYKQYSIVSGNIVETDITYLGITPNITLSLKIR